MLSRNIIVTGVVFCAGGRYMVWESYLVCGIRYYQTSCERL